MRWPVKSTFGAVLTAMVLVTGFSQCPTPPAGALGEPSPAVVRGQLPDDRERAGNPAWVGVVVGLGGAAGWLFAFGWGRTGRSRPRREAASPKGSRRDERMDGAAETGSDATR